MIHRFDVSAGLYALSPNVLAPPPVQISFESMGTWCHVITHGGGPHAAEDVRADVAELDRAWTRFDASSELCAVNSAAGQWRAVSEPMRRLAGHALLGWRETGGAFNPFVATRMAEVGYDRDFSQIASPPAPPQVDAGSWRVAPVQVDPAGGRIRVAKGSELDSGGIGKGLAADFAAEAALRRGVRSVLVNLGGDVRCAGATPKGGWRISLDDAWQPGERSDWSIRLRGGAVATSSPLRRRWRYADGSSGHHLLNPRTGVSLESRYAAVSVVARHGWVAEVLTKAALVLPAARAVRLLHRRQAAAIVTMPDGQRRRLG